MNNNIFSDKMLNQLLGIQRIKDNNIYYIFNENIQDNIRSFIYTDKFIIIKKNYRLIDPNLLDYFNNLPNYITKHNLTKIFLYIVNNIDNYPSISKNLFGLYDFSISFLKIINNTHIDDVYKFNYGLKKNIPLIKYYDTTSFVIIYTHDIVNYFYGDNWIYNQYIKYDANIKDLNYQEVPYNNLDRY